MDVSLPPLYLLDTNIASYITGGRSPVARETMDRVLRTSPIGVSAITEAELLHGLARKPEARRLKAATEILFSIARAYPWDSDSARAYADLKIYMSANGKALSALDALITAQAIALDAILVTSDKAFQQIEPLRGTVNWATDL